ncbi:SIS domain-containing protein [Kitasatospora sp. NBC_01266]|uniref:SIS domain-containing protein n=1 Tax=Kitasatospora sp. NBC_01266 TaxID=2903572 RepID=UPI002E37DD7B|nr:SIS domain-containing protein [Kitasatospora sp. NBC_01266]
MLDDSLLDDPAALQRADRDHALLALAGAGARIRTALRQAQPVLAELRPDGRPRGILVAGHGSVLTAGQALAALTGTGTLVQPLPPTDALPAALFSDGLSWQLPGWVGPNDLVVLASSDGTEAGLVSLAEQAYARGCAIAVIAPEGRPLADAALQVRALPLPYVPSAAQEEADQRVAAAEPDLPSEDFGALWAHLTPLLALADRIGVLVAPDRDLETAADLLDELAVRHRPDAAAYLNPAKDLAAQLSGTVPLLWSEGPLAEVAAERFAAMLADRAGRPAVAGRLPQALVAHRGMITGRLGAGADPGDFFRDRVDEPDPLAVQVLLLRHTPQQEPAEATAPEAGAEPPPAGPTVRRARRLAADHEVRLTELTGARPEPLHALAELVALTDFAAVYLGLAEQR